ncbi:aldolase [Polaribacter vadi]|uniref:HpcH/HpaI aldolase family protein n=1 Tax=Polaribacter TaxID=52959 RepID=UPI001C07FCCC|nr:MULTISPECIES: aldolase/citrate lyase family protein [Polaribacter]MBU3010339.1 aldolase [Polaribacter vadi]MDO6740146.1 aldolase/citrate lyase family protein [Polaribacter sp. 1_MG-2023]
MKKNILIDKITNQKFLYGPFCKMQDPTIIELAALSGFDFIIIDMEHGPHDVTSVQNMIRAAEAKGIVPVVRVTENNETLILRLLDIGVKCIQVPQVSTVKDAQKVVECTKFYPIGNRGMCRYVRAAEYTNVSSADYFKNSNNSIATIIHIEGLKGIENLKEIVQVEGIDIIFIGCYDLSQSCGVPGEIKHNKVIETMKKAINIAQENGKMMGTFTESFEDAKMWKEIGVQYISYAVDVGIVLDAFKKVVTQLNKK